MPKDMNDYYSVRFEAKPCSEDITDVLAASLAEVGYESFVPDETGVTAYVKAEDYSVQAVEAVMAEFPISTTITWSAELVPGQDWNREWEKNYFQPIVVADECVIHSSFHHGVPAAKYDIVIDPKMAFGTGHHATTSLMLRRLLDADLVGKTVIDMGTGTGILAILAAMRGAADVTGVEIDGFAFDNAIENVKLNGHDEIKLINGDASALCALAASDYLIANINRNVILADIERYARALKSGGTMLLSGFYEQDAPMLCEAAKPHGLRFVSKSVDPAANWTLLELAKA